MTWVLRPRLHSISSESFSCVIVEQSGPHVSMSTLPLIPRLSCYISSTYLRPTPPPTIDLTSAREELVGGLGSAHGHDLSTYPCPARTAPLVAGTALVRSPGANMSYDLSSEHHAPRSARTRPTNGRSADEYEIGAIDQHLQIGISSSGSAIACGTCPRMCILVAEITSRPEHTRYSVTRDRPHRHLLWPTCLCQPPTLPPET